MAMNTQTETFRGYGKALELTHQTAVESKFSGEIETVLSACAAAVLSGAEAGNGEVRYFGKVIFSIVYEDNEKRVCRAEKGVEFSQICRDERISPALTAKAQIGVENVAVRREGASTVVTALLGADISLFGETLLEYLAGGDCVVKRESVPVYIAHLLSGATEAEDEFETEFIGDILLHTESVNVTDVTVETGTLRAEGAINLGILAMKGEGLVSFERLVPFNVEIPCDAAMFGFFGEANVTIGGVALKAEADEGRGKCKITAEFSLTAEGCVYEETSLDAVTDAFSKTNEVTLKYAEGVSGGAGEIVRLTERIQSRAALSSPVDFSDTLEAVIEERAEANLVKGTEGARIEGVAMATLLVRGADGARRGVEMSLPFSLPATVEGEYKVRAFVVGVSARQKQEGEIDAEATLKITMQAVIKRPYRIVSGAEEGAPIVERDCGLSVYIPRAGDGLWELAKRLLKSPEEVSANNPDLEFPVKEGQRIIIYRRKTLS